MFEWVKGNAYTMSVTMSSTNMTLNSAAASYFQDIRWVMIGLNQKTMEMAIKPITKQELDLKLVSLDRLHKISIGKGYGRISSKQTMNEIREVLQTNQIDGMKFEASFNEKEKLLIVNLDQKGEQ